MLGRHDLYPRQGGAQNPAQTADTSLDNILNVLFQTDGRRDVVEVASALELSEEVVSQIYGVLESKAIVFR